MKASFAMARASLAESPELDGSLVLLQPVTDIAITITLANKSFDTDIAGCFKTPSLEPSNSLHRLPQFPLIHSLHWWRLPLVIEQLRLRPVVAHRQHERSFRSRQPVRLFILSRRVCLDVDRQAAIGI